MKKYIFLFFSFFLFLNNASSSFFIYEVKKGDTISKIAPQEHWGLIKKINKIDEKHLKIGMEILIPKGDIFDIVPPVSQKYNKKNEKELVIFLQKQYFGAYEKGNLIFWGPISSGKKGHETPVGNFKALWKSKKYVSKKYKSKMPFAVCFSNRGYFLHQQAMPGKPASHGCVRLLMEDAKKIFNWIGKGDPITIL